MPDDIIEAYCMRCKAKRKMEDPQPVYTDSGRPGMRGKCPVCGANMFRMGKTPAHAGLPKPAPPKREGRLVIVESPAKAKTVSRFLGKGYTVKASIGHVRDLLKSRLSVDVDNDFKPTYRIISKKRDVVKEMRAAVKKAGEVYLATDPDREGEAIAWHLISAAKIDGVPVHRVVFHEITKNAIAEAFAQPRDIDMQLVNAQQARRILDRLVGYKVSPLLWKKVKSHLSAGRVQSVALRLIVEREREIEAFVPVEYWSIEAELAKQETRDLEERPSFRAKLHRIRSKKVDLKKEQDAQAIVDALEGASYIVAKVIKKERRRRPAAPFTTSTMQQEASKRLGFTAKRTMRIAQQLYEGIAVGSEGDALSHSSSSGVPSRQESASGVVGLITYMRTDSVDVAKVAQKEARSYIAQNFGLRYLPPKPPRYKTKAKVTQEAHEAIRPTSVRREPDRIKQYLKRDQYRLYKLIWRRFLASQMAPAVLDTTFVDIKAGDPQGKMPYLFRATGSVVKFPGFLVIYKSREQKESRLPPLEKDEVLDLLRLIPEQHFTKPPPHYSEASLVKVLEKHGIGRPSTYASIISIIQARGYVERIDKRLRPTELGFIVNDLLVKHFPDVFNVDFTANMEEDLDRIARGEQEWVPLMRDFYEPFSKTLVQAEKNMKKIEFSEEPTGEICEKCGSPMVIKMGRYGKFLACSNFPKCKNTKPYLVKIGVKCPQCGGDIVEKKTRKGRTFYGCANYPDCEFATWNKPLPEPCPACGGLLTVKSKEWAKCTQCGKQVALARLEEMEPLEVS